MKTAIICCNTIEDEFKSVMAKTGCETEVVWVEAYLHNEPEKLRAQLQKHLDELDGKVERVLLALGYCGGSVRDLKTHAFEMVILRADDCVSFLVGSVEERTALTSQYCPYFMTAGWMRYEENNLLDEYLQSIERMGLEKANQAYGIMLDAYKGFLLIDTGAYDMEAAEKKLAPMMELLNWKCDRTCGDLSWLTRLITGPWSKEEFVVIPPHSVMDLDELDWMYPEED